MRPTYEELEGALLDAYQHLEFCGWGDSYERECVRDDGTQAKIEDVVRRLTGDPSEETP